jgi:hypothetical protein
MSADRQGFQSKHETDDPNYRDAEAVERHQTASCELGWVSVLDEEHLNGL